MKEDKPRYSRVSDIIDLATFMASKVQGITLNDIQERYNVSRRTAERMRDSLLNIFPAVCEIETSGHQKHWGFEDYSIKQLVTFTPKEVASIEQFYRRTSNREMKKELQSAVEKIKTLSQKKLDKFQNDISLIMQTEGYAVRQTQQYKIDDNILLKVRDALRENVIITGIYHDKMRELEPLGMIYGEMIYLLAREKAKGDGIYNYLLHKFEDIKLTDKKFDKGDFNLEEHSKKSFGVYQGEILDVKLEFDKTAAQKAMNYNFHPTQKVRQLKNGNVSVNFKASGEYEILWHIFKWGDSVKIVSPKSLKDLYKTMLKKVLDKQ